MAVFRSEKPGWFHTCESRQRQQDPMSRHKLMKIKRLTQIASASGLIALGAMAAPAQAGCGDYNGQIQICFKGKCEVQRMVRHCSSAVAGNQWISDQGYQLGYSNPIGGRYTTFEVRRHSQVLYSGDPDKSPWSFEICGESRHVGGLCSAKPWAK